MVDDKILDAMGLTGEKRKYVKKHGLGSSIWSFCGLDCSPEEAERVYKICNDKGITWEEYYHVKKVSGVIL